SGSLLEPRLKAEEGTLQVVVGAFAGSKALLRDAVAALDEQEPANLVELPRALLNLAVAELVTGDGERAEELGRRVVSLYASRRRPDDLALVDAHNLLAAGAARAGDYPRAAEELRRGAERCRKLGDEAAPLLSNLLLNLALLHKAQGDLERAAAL